MSLLYVCLVVIFIYIYRVFSPLCGVSLSAEGHNVLFAQLNYGFFLHLFLSTAVQNALCFVYVFNKCFCACVLIIVKYTFFINFNVVLEKNCG